MLYFIFIVVYFPAQLWRYLEGGRMCRCWASRICCWRRYCWCNAWGRKGGAGMSWNCGVGRGLRGGWSGGPCWWPGGARCGLMPDCGCPGWGMGKSMGSGAWGPNWKCRQEVAWLCCCCCCCRLKWDPVEDKEKLSGTWGEKLAGINCGWNVVSVCVWYNMLMKPFLLPMVKNTSVGVGKWWLPQVPWKWNFFFFAPAHKTWAFISSISFRTFLVRVPVFWIAYKGRWSEKDEGCNYQ